ncbi:uncharacterized protein EAF02_001049 [Botrytis sinoallii]|uniref:uncharacterized protein n=1 Tax=Botrytis sinoallii TaxID=1463999 RepID=UPI0019027D3A|nr:uncharacterized protein EAF02_001049 [Botrytis sinoallii]KAF7893511.1 hypothetical protein EAF02_001049 [Botrytis sinoallii]
MLSRPVEHTGKEDQNIHKAVHVPQAINNFLNLRDKENKKNRISGSNLLDWHEIHNEYILTGYRPASNSFLKSLWSLGYLHNETVNICSHLFGSILFASLPFILHKRSFPRFANAEIVDINVLSTIFFGVAICFLLSAIFHLIANHSKRVHVVGNQFDYLGVVILMWSSTIPTVYYGFYCDPVIQRTYWMMISISATACAITTFHSEFHHPKVRSYRATMYSCLGLSSTIFIIHGLIIYGYEMLRWRMSLDWMGVMAGFNLLGAVAYAVRIPEKWFPHRHDILGSSHQILHLMVIFAGLAHMFGLLRAFDHIHNEEFHCL